MKTKILILSLTSAFLFGCSSSTSNNEEKETSQPETVVEATEEEHLHDDHKVIVLDDSKKWKVVESMLIYIRNMEEAVTSFEGDDYQALAKTIDENIRALTENCTMEGRAHDELHKWLVPFIGLSEEFDVATEKAEQERIYKAFEDAFIEFNKYFE